MTTDEIAFAGGQRLFEKFLAAQNARGERKMPEVLPRDERTLGLVLRGRHSGKNNNM